MRLTHVFLPVFLFVLSTAASAQATPSGFGLDRGQTPVMEVGLNYTYFHANAPPGGCGCFSLNGGGGTLVVNMPRGVSLVADLSAAHAGAINHTTQNVTIFDYLAGMRYSYRSSSRFTPYVQALAGGATELSNFAYVQDANAFAFSSGGGVSAKINRLFGWTIVQADYVYSRLPNGVNTHQNDLRVSTGMTFRFGPR